MAATDKIRYNKVARGFIVTKVALTKNIVYDNLTASNIQIISDPSNCVGFRTSNGKSIITLSSNAIVHFSVQGNLFAKLDIGYYYGTNYPREVFTYPNYIDMYLAIRDIYAFSPSRNISAGTKLIAFEW